MARKVRHSSLEKRTNRLKLTVRRKPYNGPNLARGVSLLYRRNKTNGTWVLKASDGHGKYWTKAIAEADDFDEANGEKILTFFEAQDVAKKLAGGGTVEANDSTAPVTVDRALVDYRRDLISRNANPYNAESPRKHLTATLLSKPVMLLASKELKHWRDGLLGTLAPASINRICNSMCAALELSAQHDPRIKNRDAWEVGLAGLPDAQKARNVVIPDATIHALVGASYARDHRLGLFVDTMATTGARPSQLTRLLVEDLHDHPSKPKLMMPKSGKGGGRNRSQKKLERYSVPITVALSRKLKAAATGRAGDAPLLLCADGRPWRANPSRDYREPVREVLAAIGVDPDEVTLYSLRHSSVVRMLLRNVPIRLIAALHNTSVGQIERNYSKHITEHHSDELTRTGLLSEPAPAVGNVVTPLR
jgi:integrase